MTKSEKAKDARLRKFFRVSLDEYKAVEKFQADDAIFSVLLGTTRRAWDHVHTTGLGRGILDWRINRALGIIENGFKDQTPLILRALACYFECSPAVAVIGERYGILHRAKNKKKMVYGSAQGPLPAEKRKKRG